MNKSINAAWKPLAAFGLALALAGCTGNTAGNAGATTGAPSTGAGTDTLATVNGTPITREQMGSFLEEQSGVQALPILIDTQLLLQAGKNAGIEVSDADIAAELEKQKKLSPQLTEELAKNPLFGRAINSQIKRNLTVQRLLTKDVKFTDADLQKFFTTYKSYYQDPVEVKLGTLFTSTKARADVMSRALKSKSKTFAQLVAEQKKAQDMAAQGSSEGEQFLPMEVLPSQLSTKIEKLPKGGVSEPINLGEGTPNAYYAIFQVADRKQPADVDFATLKPTIETDYKMAQVAKEEVKKGTGNPPFDETLKTTRAALRQQNQQQSPGAPAPAPSLRDVLTYILLPLQRNTLSDLKTKGTVKVDDPNYASVADQYKPAPTPVAPGATANAAMSNAAIAPATNSAMAPAPADTNAAPVGNAAPADTNAAPAPAGNAAPAAP